ncbi:phosphate ABC transporter permease subunit PstC [Liberiplasma polymorphum]|uniref:phosphate ABC transporter permease subunit PstC n=1 Tax=Liberiplasma polymorphum TaxID=3374570 RepID=UPI0037755422
MDSIHKYITKESIMKKTRTDKIVRNVFLFSALLSASFIVLVILSISVRGISPFILNYEGFNNNFGTVQLPKVNLIRFLTGMQWLDGALGNSSSYAIGFAIINTFIAVFLSILITTPVAVITALFIAKVAPKKVASVMRTVVELLASIPSIIYGVFGLGFINRFIVILANGFGFRTAAGLSLLSTVLVLFLMTLPTVTAVSETSIRSVKNDIIEGSLALGASKMQTYFKVVITSSKNGIFAGIILGVGRALGEATAVSMVSGNAFSGISLNLFDTTSTLTSRMLLGLKDTSGLDYDIRFSVGLVLMIVILLTNYTLRLVMKKVGNLDE